MDGFSIGQSFYNHSVQPHHHNQHIQHYEPSMQPQVQQSYTSRKRKCEAPPENNERLSKRMSLLNLERSGPKLYVPVENPTPSTASPTHGFPSPVAAPAPVDDEAMRLDDTKYKVYIYDLEDELSSSDNEPDEGKLVFLPDIEKHLRKNRIPAHILANGIPPSVPSPEDLENMQMVLYSVPRSISVPEEQDSVRKAIIEARARARERQQQREASNIPVAPTVSDVPPPGGDSAMPVDDPDAMELD